MRREIISGLVWLGLLFSGIVARAQEPPSGSGTQSSAAPQAPAPAKPPTAQDQQTPERSDQTIILSGKYTAQNFPVLLRRVSFYAADIDQRFVFLTNNFQIPSPVVAAVYHQRWQIELFFKWIKQHLRIKRFFGTSPNAVKTQIWTAMATYALVAIAKKRLGLEHSLYTILQILSTVLFEKTPVQLVFQRYDDEISVGADSKQLTLFEI